MIDPAGAKRLYSVLCNVLDELRSEAPAYDVKYNPPPNNGEAIVQARSRALLHLYLKARFGILDFKEREYFVTDGKFDGGIDAFYIDKSKKIIYLVQSKFRATAGNFATVNMTAHDLLKMDVRRILNGERKGEDGNPYNTEVVKQLQKSIRQLSDAAGYTRQVVLLGNVNLTESSLRKVVDGYPVERYPSARVYKDLVFPMIVGTFYNDPQLLIKINLSNVRGSEAHVDYNAKTEFLNANIKSCFSCLHQR